MENKQYYGVRIWNGHQQTHQLGASACVSMSVSVLSHVLLHQHQHNLNHFLWHLNIFLTFQIFACLFVICNVVKQQNVSFLLLILGVAQFQVQMQTCQMLCVCSAIFDCPLIAYMLKTQICPQGLHMSTKAPQRQALQHCTFCQPFPFGKQCQRKNRPRSWVCNFSILLIAKLVTWIRWKCVHWVGPHA